ncbi:hypothetical protein AUC43_17735 [Hymenobacter sedentarius]|uniref:UspA domain-containing protein n=1 Tax=Hymenobacter sedentarius TaxID=1411621 RepID=A0A0U4AT32_9BACT|nr:universal stress protein [Hymenobacter sedentarius]ALW86757.1 hypothetical protein AUC43_17735 [Hymenobacter sedentarius]
MKTILVPIDFTEPSENALVYANSLAARLPARIVLVDNGSADEPPPELRAARLRRLEALAERLRYQQLARQSGRRINYWYHLATGPIPDALEALVTGYKADLLVTGLNLTKGTASTAAGDAVTLLPDQLSCPVLIVPPGHHELPTYVVVAGNFAHFQGQRLAWLPCLARTTSAHFDLVQFQPDDSMCLGSLKKALLNAHAHLPSAAVHMLPQEDALEGISGYCSQHSAELLVIASSAGELLHQFFNPNATRANPYHLCIPVLLLPTWTRPTEANWAECSLKLAVENRMADVSMETL